MLTIGIIRIMHLMCDEEFKGGNFAKGRRLKFKGKMVSAIKWAEPMIFYKKN